MSFWELLERLMPERDDDKEGGSLWFDDIIVLEKIGVKMPEWIKKKRNKWGWISVTPEEAVELLLAIGVGKKLFKRYRDYVEQVYETRIDAKLVPEGVRQSFGARGAGYLMARDWLEEQGE